MSFGGVPVLPGAGMTVESAVPAAKREAPESPLTGEDYDAMADVTGSIMEAFAAVRARAEAGGETWRPRACECPACKKNRAGPALKASCAAS